MRSSLRAAAAPQLEDRRTNHGRAEMSVATRRCRPLRCTPLRRCRPLHKLKSSCARMFVHGGRRRHDGSVEMQATVAASRSLPAGGPAGRRARKTGAETSVLGNGGDLLLLLLLPHSREGGAASSLLATRSAGRAGGARTGAGYGRTVHCLQRSIEIYRCSVSKTKRNWAIAIPSTLL